MGWNDIHITLAPVGSHVTGWTDPRAITAAGESVRIVDVRPPDEGIDALMGRREFEARIMALGFSRGQSHPSYLTYTFHDITLTVKTESGVITNVRATFLVNLDARSRIESWKSLIEELCKTFRLKPVDPEYCSASVEMSFSRA